MASGTGPIKVLHFGLGPIGAAVVRQVAARKGFKIVGAVDIDPAKVGTGPRRSRRRRPHAAGQGVRRREEGDQGDQARRRRAVHELVAEEGAAADRSDPQAQGADRVDDRGAGVSDEGQHALRAGDPPAREEGEGRGARHRRQPRVRHGRAADHADRRLRARRSAAHRPRAGRAHPAAAVPAEDRRRPDARAVSAQGGRGQRAARRAGRVGVDDRGCARLEARSDHRRDPAARSRPRPSRASSSRSMPGYVCGIVQDGIGYRNGMPRHHAAHGGVPRARRSRSTRWRSPARRR